MLLCNISLPRAPYKRLAAPFIGLFNGN